MKRVIFLALSVLFLLTALHGFYHNQALFPDMTSGYTISGLHSIFANIGYLLWAPAFYYFSGWSKPHAAKGPANSIIDAMDRKESDNRLVSEMSDYLLDVEENTKALKKHILIPMVLISIGFLLIVTSAIINSFINI